MDIIITTATMIMIYGTSLLTSSLLFFSLSTFSVESDCVAVPCMAKITTVNKCTHKDRQMKFKTLIITDVHMYTYKYGYHSCIGDLALHR